MIGGKKSWCFGWFSLVFTYTQKEKKIREDSPQNRGLLGGPLEIYNLESRLKISIPEGDLEFFFIFIFWALRVATFRGATEPLRPDDPHPQTRSPRPDSDPLSDPIST